MFFEPLIIAPDWLSQKVASAQFVRLKLGVIDITSFLQNKSTLHVQPRTVVRHLFYKLLPLKINEC